MTTEPATLITSRSEFHTALREALAEAAQLGSPEIWLCDNDFGDWPLGERAVIANFEQWALSRRKLVLVARHFDEVVRRHPRWVEWRRTWSHIVSCRANTEIETGGFPCILLATDRVSVHLSNPEHYRGRMSHDKADEIRCKELIDAVLQRSEETFPATTTGL